MSHLAYRLLSRTLTIAIAQSRNKAFNSINCNNISRAPYRSLSIRSHLFMPIGMTAPQATSGSTEDFNGNAR